MVEYFVLLKYEIKIGTHRKAKYARYIYGDYLSLSLSLSDLHISKVILFAWRPKQQRKGISKDHQTFLRGYPPKTDGVSHFHLVGY